MRKNLFKNQSGMSLLEITIAGAVAVVIGLAVTKMTQVSFKGANKVKTDTELSDLKIYIKNRLSKGGNCALTLERAGYTVDGGLTAPATFDLVIRSEWNDAAVPPAYEFNDPDDIHTFTADGTTPIEKFPSWYLDEINIEPVSDISTGIAGNSTGICSVEMKLNRGKFVDEDAKRSFGARDIVFRFDLVCSIDPNDNTRVSSCQAETTLRQGFWRLYGATEAEGIQFDYDVYIGGDIVADQHVIINSDENLKENITPLKNELDRLSNISGYRYDLKKYPAGDKKQLGLMAQEVEKSYPEAVFQRPDGTKGVRYTMLIPVLIQALNEQQKVIKQQGEQIELLQRERKNKTKY